MGSTAIAIGISGLNAAAARLAATSANLANSTTTGPVPRPGGATVSRVFEPRTVELSDLGQPAGVAHRFAISADPYRQVYAPGSPDADGRGMIAVPNIDMAGEMVKLIEAKFAYAASAAVIRTAADMQRHAIDALA